MKHILCLVVLVLSSPVMADSYWCDNSVRATTLNVTWAECPRHRWSPYVSALYVGEFIDDEFHGYGTYTWEDGSAYVGWWKGSKMHGRGTFTFSNGDKYIGKWRNDQLFEGTVHTDARNCALRLITNYYLPAEDACYHN